MDVQRLKTLRRVLDGKSADEFNMGDFYIEHSCGTSMCLAGWAIELWGTDEDRRVLRGVPTEEYSKGPTLSERASHILGLDVFLGEHLFVEGQYASQSEALDALDGLIATGDFGGWEWLKEFMQ